ncbi:short-chain dehydrogenase [Microbacterium mangrovi]|uniref:Short-chain dehydrogenase n=1 Tax=Microbacterium mangrovi TaxID=1348253 RepID=A0A0B2A5K3_9MICO|nr:SDR family oxidoreductase [Microbacterium mangrovi]KHK96867.1 short-chain dehydrogenase [Microbacterium mangrovi]
MTTHLLTGATSGIGAALAAALHARGDDLVLIARSDATARRLGRAFPDATVLVADLERPESLEASLAGRMPPALDSVLHVAGVCDLGPVAQLGAGEWQRTLAVNLAAPAELTRLALPALRAAAGRVVFVNSGAGLAASPDWSAYAASKFGLRALADALRAEERANGVRVTSVYPGRTATPMQQRVHEQEGADYDADAWIQPGSVVTAILTALDLPRDADLTDLRVRPGL